MERTGHVGGTRGSGNVSSVADVLWMSVVCGIRGVDGVCEMCMCLARAAWVERREWMRGLGFTKPVGTGEMLDVCLYFGCGGVSWEWVGGLDQSLEG